MRMRRVTGFILLMVCAWTLFNGKEIPFAANPSQEEKDRNYFTDLPVLTHEGKELRFYSDLLKDRVVLISFFYTNCPTAQLGLVTLFKLQKLLENRLGTDIYLFSLSVDPEKDHLKALQEYAAKFNPQKGWVFLSGKKEHLTVINQRLGNRNPNPELHIQLFVLGNLKTGHWMKLPETAHPYAVAEGLRTLAAEK